MQHVPPPAPEALKSRAVALPPTDKLKTLIFDLDETLVHCIEDIENNSFDLPIMVNFPNGETVKAGINVRPFAYECLKQAQKSY